ncbi:hypothetical protein KBI33_00590 [Candidatus Shapirobacteria bacterium]|nr:hypothetical protein [Candidatus Shapirobacteria bacterium]
MDRKSILQRFGLNSDNSVVIGSGILEAIGVRKSHDIDLVVLPKVFNFLKDSGKFALSYAHGREVLSGASLEISASWYVLGEKYYFKDLIGESIVIDGVRYITVDFLYKVKKSWFEEGSARPKDIKDIKLIEKYFARGRDG